VINYLPTAVHKGAVQYQLLTSRCGGGAIKDQLLTSRRKGTDCDQLLTSNRSQRTRMLKDMVLLYPNLLY